MSLLARSLSSQAKNLSVSTRSYTQVVNVFGRKTVDTGKSGEDKTSEMSTVGTIPEAAEKIGELSGFKDEYLGGRRARIFIQAKNSMQSGTFQQRKWRVEFDNRSRWENPNMGWGSSGDMFSNSHIEFGNKEDAMLYCERMGYKYDVEEPRTVNKRIKLYGDNFSWAKNTRRAMK